MKCFAVQLERSLRQVPWTCCMLATHIQMPSNPPSRPVDCRDSWAKKMSFDERALFSISSKARIDVAQCLITASLLLPPARSARGGHVLGLYDDLYGTRVGVAPGQSILEEKLLLGVKPHGGKIQGWRSRQLELR